MYISWCQWRRITYSEQIPYYTITYPISFENKVYNIILTNNTFDPYTGIGVSHIINTKIDTIELLTEFTTVSLPLWRDLFTLSVGI